MLCFVLYSICQIFLLLAAGVAAVASQHKEEETCPPGWQAEAGGRSCYLLTKRRMTHAEGALFCARQDNSSHLLRVETEAENKQMTGLLKFDATAWIDARARFDIVDSQAGLFGPGFVFRWPNGKVARFSKWAPGHGTASRHRRCVTINARDGDWRNAACDQLASVICEKRLRRQYENRCPKHWVYFNGTSSCYRIIAKANMTILEADDRCFQLGYDHNQDAMLASVTSEKENAFILDLARERNEVFDFAFLGAFGKSNNGNKWRWMDGQPFDYQNWDRGMPFGRRALAVLVMNRRGKWLNHYADRILSQFDAVAICKFRP